MPSGTKIFSVALAIYIPNAEQGGKKISAREYKQRIRTTEQMLLGFFGGCTTNELDRGAAKSEVTGGIVTEKVTRIHSFTDPATYKKHRDALLRWLLERKKEWNYEAMGFEFEGDLYYI